MFRVPFSAGSFSLFFFVQFPLGRKHYFLVIKTDWVRLAVSHTLHCPSPIFPRYLILLTLYSPVFNYPYAL